MSLTRKFAGLAQFSRFLDERVTAMVPIGKLVIGATARTLQRVTKETYGDHVLPDLAPATQADRVAKDYTPNDPLLRDGTLLRDSVEAEVGIDYAAVGSAQPVAAYHEYGYAARNGTPVPPRPVFKLALEKAAPIVMKMIEANVGMQLGFGIVSEAEQLLPGAGPDITASTSALE